MNKELFKDKFKEMCLLFNTPKGPEKAQILYEKLSFYSDGAWKKASEFILNNKDRLPTLSGFHEILRPLETRRVVNCPDCYGNGLILVGKQVYRSRCDHGKSAPKSIALAPSMAVAFENQKRDYDQVYKEGYFEKRFKYLFPLQ